MLTEIPTNGAATASCTSTWWLLRPDGTYVTFHSLQAVVEAYKASRGLVTLVCDNR